MAKLTKVMIGWIVSTLFITLVLMQVFYYQDYKILAFNTDSSILWSDSTRKMFLLIILGASFLLWLLSVGIDTKPGKGKYNRENYNHLMTKRERKRGLVRVVYNEDGPTRKSIFVYATLLYEPLAKLQNKICDHFLLSPTKKWNTNTKYQVGVKKQHHIAGVPVITKRKYLLFGKFNRIYYLPSRVHSLFLGITGKGKSWTYVIPMVLSCLFSCENAVVVDVKKEIYYHTVKLAKKLGYRIIKLDFIDPQKSDGWNPLEYPYLEWKKSLFASSVAKVSIQLHVVSDTSTLHEHKEHTDTSSRCSGLSFHACDTTILLESLSTMSEQTFLEAIKTNCKYEGKSVKGSSVVSIVRDNGEVIEEKIRNLQTMVIDSFEWVQQIKEPGTYEVEVALVSYHVANISTAVEQVLDISKTMTFIEDAKDPFWHQGAGDMLAGASLLAMEEGIDDIVNFSSARYIYQMGLENDLLKNYLKEYREIYDESVLKMATFMEAEGMTRSSLKAVYQNSISLITAMEDIRSITSKSTFKFEDMRDTKTIVYLQVHDEKTTYYPLVVIFIKQLYEAIIKISRDNPESKFKIPMNWYLDEFAQMPEIKDIEAIYGAARSRGVNIHAFIQSESQLINKYEPEVAKIIMENSSNKFYLGNADEDALMKIQEAAGKEIYYNSPKKQWDERPLIRTGKLRKFEKGRSLVTQIEFEPYIAKLAPYDRYMIYEEPCFDEEDIPKPPVRYLNLRKAYDTNKQEIYTDVEVKTIDFKTIRELSESTHTHGKE